MDVKEYYRKVRGIESTIDGEFAVVVSNETADGGKAGRKTEVAKLQAAKLVAEGRARLATEEETRQYFAEIADRRKEIENANLQQRLGMAAVAELERRLQVRPKGKS